MRVYKKNILYILKLLIISLLLVSMIPINVDAADPGYHDTSYDCGGCEGYDAGPCSFVEIWSENRREGDRALCLACGWIVGYHEVHHEYECTICGAHAAMADQVLEGGPTPNGKWCRGQTNIAGTPTGSHGSSRTCPGHWSQDPNTYYVQFAANGGSGSAPGKLTCTYDSNFTMPNNTFTKPNYKFLGWSTNAGATTPTYTAGGTYKNLTTSNGGTVTLYAVWKLDIAPYTVRHYLENADGTWTLDKTEKFEGIITQKYTPSTYTYTNYKTPATQTKAVTGDGKMTIDYYYYRNTYNLTLTTVTNAIANGNNGYGINSVTGAGTYRWGQAVTIDATLKTGYHWNIWTNNNSGNASVTTNQKHSFNMPIGALSYRANALNNTYTAKYDRNTPSGTLSTTGGSTPNSEHIYDVNQYLSKNYFTLSGYDFIGWKLNNTGTTYGNNSNQGYVQTKNLTSTHKGTVTLYAQWKARTDTPYTVNHYIEDLNKDTYSLYETETLYGTTDTKVTPAVKNIYGFTAPATQTVVVDGDGTTVVNYYYTRNSFRQILYIRYQNADGSFTNYELAFDKYYEYEDVVSWYRASDVRYKEASINWVADAAYTKYLTIYRQMYRQTILIHYQNPDGVTDADTTWKDVYVVNANYFYEAPFTWEYPYKKGFETPVASKNRAGTEVASLSYTVKEHKVTELWAFRVFEKLAIDGEYLEKHYADLGWSETDNYNNMGTFDMYIANTQVADDVREYFNDEVLYGAEWHIDDIKADPGKFYYGVDVDNQ